MKNSNDTSWDRTSGTWDISQIFLVYNTLNPIWTRHKTAVRTAWRTACVCDKDGRVSVCVKCRFFIVSTERNLPTCWVGQLRGLWTLIPYKRLLSGNSPSSKLHIIHFPCNIYIYIYIHTQSNPKKCIHSLFINIFGINLNGISISGRECNIMFSQQMA